MGRRLMVSVLQRGHKVKALVRTGSQHQLPEGVQAVVRDPLSAASIQSHVALADTFVQLVGVAHPNPSKPAEFRAIDQTAGCTGGEAAAHRGQIRQSRLLTGRFGSVLSRRLRPAERMT
jgi:uncharacterized protein YbjT (DUF2867 family)